MIAGKYKIVIISLVTLGMLLALNACIDEYWPELDARYDNALVVDGMITNLQGPYTVKLSRATTVDDPKHIMEMGCEVSIISDQGEEEILYQVEPGIYQTSENGIHGIVGRSYRISILTNDNKYYSSEFEELALSTGVDSVYSEVKYVEKPDALHPDVGLQFYVDTQVAETDTNYFLWRLESTFKFQANHRIRYIWDGQLHPFTPSDTLLTCWRTASVKEVFTYSTVNLEQPLIKKFPLNYVTTDTKELSIRYSLLVKQLSLSQQAFKFWKSIKEIDTESGSMYTQQPYQVRGNVVSTDDEKEPVLGYFMVAGMSEKRIFVDRPVLMNFYYQKACNLDPLDTDVLWSMYAQWPIYLAGKVTEYGYSPAIVSDEACLNCTLVYDGATIQEPLFWED